MKKKYKDIAHYPDEWKYRLLAFTTRKDQLQGLKAWCDENDVSYSTARDWITDNAVESMALEIGGVSAFVGSDEKGLSACSATELINNLALRSSREKSTIPSAYLDILPEDEQEVFKEMHLAGLDLRGELTFIRYQMRRAKKYQLEQEAHVKAGEAENALVLVEKTTSDGYDADGKPTDNTTEKRVLSDWDTVIQRLGQLYASIATAQQKIEFGERLSADERADVMSRTLRRVISGEITALEAGYLLNAAGIERIPVPLELKIKEELALLGDDFGERPVNPQHRIDEEKRRRAEERAVATEEFRRQRERELEELNEEEDS